MPKPTIESVLDEAPAPTSPRGRTDKWFYSRSARAMKLRGRRTRPLVTRIKAMCPWIEPSDIATLRSWADMEIIGAGLMAELIEGGLFEDGKPRAIIDTLRGIRTTQLRYAAELGLTPAARLAVRETGDNNALDVAALCALDPAEKAPPSDKLKEDQPREPGDG
jgi:hypothetical protein